MAAAPAHLRPIAYDAAAADRVVEAARALSWQLDSIMRRRAALVRTAQADWFGRHRDDFDRLDADLRRAQELVSDALDRLRRDVAADLATVREANRARARARQRWQEQQAAIAPARPTGPSGAFR